MIPKCEVIPIAPFPPFPDTPLHSYSSHHRYIYIQDCISCYVQRVFLAGSLGGSLSLRLRLRLASTHVTHTHVYYTPLWTWRLSSRPGGFSTGSPPGYTSHRPTSIEPQEDSSVSFRHMLLRKSILSDWRPLLQVGGFWSCWHLTRILP